MSTKEKIKNNPGIKLQKEIFWMGFLIVFIVLVSYIMTVVFPSKVRNILAGMIVVIGLVSFFGFVRLGVGPGDRALSKSDTRLAIVASLITTYIALVGSVSTFAPRAGDTNSPEITTTLINHFTYIIGVVIVFYFGTTAFETAQKYRIQAQETPKGDDEPEPEE